VTHVNDAKHLELRQRLSHRRRAHSKLTRHARDGRKPVAGAKRTGSNQLEHARREIVGQSLATNRREVVVHQPPRSARTTGMPAARRAGIQLANTTDATSM